MNKKIILTMGSLATVKGHCHLIDAMALRIKEGDDGVCIIIGLGPLRNSLERQIKKCNLGLHILLLGDQPHHEISDWINACDIFVLPSLFRMKPSGHV